TNPTRRHHLLPLERIRAPRLVLVGPGDYGGRQKGMRRRHAVKEQLLSSLPGDLLRRSYGGRILLLAAAYIASAKLGLGLAYAHGSVTAVWPPTGIALAALVVWGPRFWPGVALGALVANLTTDAPRSPPSVSPRGTRSRQSSARCSLLGSAFAPHSSVCRTYFPWSSWQRRSALRSARPLARPASF
ncbi:MAG: MASE1 domain-containing protein, partial [Actinomycetota bacterium]|nr:MASE1 domain-containing protein [Actinomycetota bacterium]